MSSANTSTLGPSSTAPKAAVWALGPTNKTAPPPESSFSFPHSNGSDETVLSLVDGRTQVDPATFAPGGKYRSIVKLFARFERSPAGVWAMGSGWLVRPDVFVTAGHCSWDFSYGYGRAVEVKAYIGYHGHQFQDSDPNVQFRSVKKIITTEGWVKGPGLKRYDVSFMQVAQPFSGIKPIQFVDTPLQGSLQLGIVGYPGDLKDTGTGEKGAYMYEMFQQTQYDLTTQPEHMLEYKIDTFGGNSGSAVLTTDLVSLGTHVYGGAINSASVIGGTYGNPYQAYLVIFDMPGPSISTQVGWVALKTPKTATIAGPKVVVNPNRKPAEPTESSLTGGLSEESFMDFLHVVKSAIPIATGVAGAFGGPVGVLAGVALNAAAQLIPGTEDALDLPPGFETLQKGSVERAILAEATLQALKVNPRLEESVFSHIKDAVTQAIPVVKQVAPQIAGAALEPALRAALDMLSKYNQEAKAKTGTEASFSEPFHPPVRSSEATFEVDDKNVEAFLSAAQTAIKQGGPQESAWDSDSQEGFFDVIKAGASMAGQGLGALAKLGLPLLAAAISKSGGMESLETGPVAPNSMQGPLAQRALVADASLSAVMKIPAHQLEEAGFFSALASAVKIIAPTVIKYAPAVVNNVVPIVAKLAGVGQESGMVTDPAIGGSGTIQPDQTKPLEFTFSDDPSNAANDAKKDDPIPNDGNAANDAKKDDPISNDGNAANDAKKERNPLENKHSNEILFVRH